MSLAIGSPLWMVLGMRGDALKVWLGTLLPAASPIPVSPVPPRYLSQRGPPLPGRNCPQEPAGFSGPRAQHFHLPGGFLRAGPEPPGAAGQCEHNTPAYACWTLFCPSCDLSCFDSSQDRFWPLFLSVGVVPASLQLLLLHCFPESPRYLLIERNDIFGATAGEGVSWGGDWLWEVLVAGPRSPKTKAHPSSILSHPYLTDNHSPYGSALLSHPVALQHFQGDTMVSGISSVPMNSAPWVREVPWGG